MFYKGGKKLLGATLAGAIRDQERRHFGDDGRPHAYYEPFCGMLGVAAHMAERGRRMHLSDSHEHLIDLWAAWQDGWRPPENVRISRAEYMRTRDTSRSPAALARMSADKRAWLAFVGFSCSHSGRWFGGYIECDSNTPHLVRCQQNARAMDRTWQRIEDAGGKVKFRCCDYAKAVPRGTRNAVIYCDPPYRNTCSYWDAFDHDRFWAQVRKWARQGNLVLVSEESAPKDFRVVWSQGVTRKMHRGATIGGKRRVERLYAYIGSNGGKEEEDDETASNDEETRDDEGTCSSSSDD